MDMEMIKAKATKKVPRYFTTIYRSIRFMSIGTKKRKTCEWIVYAQ